MNMRSNGFQKPWNIMQVTTWIIMPLLLLQFGFFVTPILPLGASIPCTLIFVAMGFASSYYGYMCCVTNPIDERLERHLHADRGEDGGEEGAEEGGRKAKKRLWGMKRALSGDRTGRRGRRLMGLLRRTKSEDDAGNAEGNEDDDDETKYCWVCQTTVSSHSMHCKYCDKCVSHFDHHCQWLNTCVGSKNYPFFFQTVVTTFGFVFVHVACLLGLTIAYFVQLNDDPPGGTKRRADDWFGANASEFVAGVNIFFLVFNLIALSLIGQLLVFHIGLRREGITTYEFIVRDNARKREKSRKALALRNKRNIAKAKAKREGRKADEFCLTVGALPMCAMCDPLRRNQKAEGGDVGGSQATEAGGGGGGATLNGVAAPTGSASEDDEHDSAAERGLNGVGAAGYTPGVATDEEVVEERSGAPYNGEGETGGGNIEFISVGNTSKEDGLSPAASAEDVPSGPVENVSAPEEAPPEEALGEVVPDSNPAPTIEAHATNGVGTPRADMPETAMS